MLRVLALPVVILLSAAGTNPSGDTPVRSTPGQGGGVTSEPLFPAEGISFKPRVEEALLGAPVRQDGYSIRPPNGFRMVRMNLFHGTRSLAMSAEPSFISAALVDGPSEEAAVMVVSVVESGFAAAPSDREKFVEAVAKHFKDRVDLPLSVERAEQKTAPQARVEVVGTARQDDQLRRVLAIAFAGEGKHIVLVFSAPAGRWEALEPAFRATIQSFRPEIPAGKTLSPNVAWMLAGAAAVLLLISFALYRRRRRAEPEPALR
ncbi:MAG: hypothetical protein ACT4TC_19945 [Myxococcaceae bacterium]